jgi:hypothetical protein
MALGIWGGPNGDQSCFGPKHTPGRTGGTVKTEKPAAADVLPTTKLPSSHPLARAAAKIDKEWGDDISTGSVHAFTGRIAMSKAVTDKQLAALTTQMLRDGYATNEEKELPPSAAIDLNPARGLDAATQDVTKILAEGFALAMNAGNLKPIQKRVEKLAAHLGDKKDVKVVTAQTVAKNDTVEADLNYTAVLLANTKTGEYLQFYAREGTM